MSHHSVLTESKGQLWRVETTVFSKYFLFRWTIVVQLKSRLERLNNSISSKSNVDVILIFFKDFVDLWLIEIPCWSIIDSHDFIIFMEFHPSSTTEWNIFHCWKVVSIFIHLESVLRQWSFCNSVCIGLKLKTTFYEFLLNLKIVTFLWPTYCSVWHF